jgi:hypothetical protein
MINNFADLLTEAKRQPEPQRLLMVFCRAELPKDATEAEKAEFERGEGGALVPAVCVDKALNELTDFTALCTEAEKTGADWDIMFVGALSGRAGFTPSSDEAQQPLTMMVEAIQMGQVGNFLAINRTGDAVQLG